jgi:myosin heavy subunit
MSAFAEIYRERGSITEKYFKIIETAQANRAREYQAALRIRRAWTAYRRRKDLQHRHAMAVLIQKMFRKHQSRVLVRCLQVEKARADRVAYFNAMATKIQKVWRGFDTRRHVFDYHKQQAYLREVAERNVQMRRELDDHYSQTTEAERRTRNERENRRREENALHMHYQVSTAAIPSIFQPPAFTKDAQAMPAIENFIRNVNKASIVIPSLRSTYRR